MCFFVCFAEGVVQYCTHSYIRRHKNIMVIKTFFATVEKMHFTGTVKTEMHNADDF